MLWSETAVRENIRNRDGKRVFYLGKGDQLTSGARDWLGRERIAILPAEQAKQDVYRLPNGGYITQKPEHMTHLNGDILVPKTHPRIIFRGKVDTLEAELILSQLAAPELEHPVGEVLALTRQIIRCDVLDQPLKPEKLLGMTSDKLRKRSHFPQEFYGQPHFAPSASDGPVIARLNRARCAAREAELAGLEAFADREGNPTRPDILQTMNRISSAIYILMVQQKAKL